MEDWLPWQAECISSQSSPSVQPCFCKGLCEETSLCLLCCPVISVKRLWQAHNFGSLLEGSCAFPAAAIPQLPVQCLHKAALNNFFNPISTRTSHWIMAYVESCCWDRWSLKNWMEVYFAGLVFWDPLGDAVLRLPEGGRANIMKLHSLLFLH